MDKLKSFFGGSKGRKVVDTTFTLKNLQRLCAQLLALEGTLSSSARALRAARAVGVALSPGLEEAQRSRQAQEAKVIVTLKTIAELMCYGDRHNEAFMDFFCEKAIPALVVGILRNCGCTSAVQIQILQTWSILFQNVKSEMFLFYMLSNNNINVLIVTEFDFEDEDVMAEYISLLKILSLKLNVDTVQFFLNEKASAALPQRFPLFTAAVRHFRHRNPMVRTGAQTVILSVYAVGKLDASVERFAIGAESQEFCLSLVALLRKQVLHLMRVTRARLTPHAAQAPAGEAAQPSADEATARAAAAVLAADADAAAALLQMQALFDQHIDSMYCIQDVFQTGLAPLNALLHRILIDGCITPVLLASIQHHVGGTAFPVAPQLRTRRRGGAGDGGGGVRRGFGRSQSLSPSPSEGAAAAAAVAAAAAAMAAAEGSSDDGRERASTWTVGGSGAAAEGKPQGGVALAAQEEAGGTGGDAAAKHHPTAMQAEEDAIMSAVITKTRAGEVELISLPLALVVLTGFFLAVEHATTVRSVARLLLAPCAGGAIGSGAQQMKAALKGDEPLSEVRGSDCDAMLVRCLLCCKTTRTLPAAAAEGGVAGREVAVVDEPLLIAVASIFLAIARNGAVVSEEEEEEEAKGEEEGVSASGAASTPGRAAQRSVRFFLRALCGAEEGASSDPIGELLAIARVPFFRHRITLQLACHLISALARGAAVGETRAAALAPRHRVRLDEAYLCAARAFRAASAESAPAALAALAGRKPGAQTKPADVVRTVQEELFRTLRGRLGLELPGARAARPMLKRIIGKAGLLLPIEQQAPALVSHADVLAQVRSTSSNFGTRARAHCAIESTPRALLTTPPPRLHSSPTNEKNNASVVPPLVSSPLHAGVQSFHAFVVLHSLYCDVVTAGGDEDERSPSYDLDGVLRQLQPKLPLDKRMGATIALGGQGGSDGSSSSSSGGVGDGSEGAGGGAGGGADERAVTCVRCSLIPPAQTKLGQQAGAASPAPAAGKRGFTRRRTPPRPPPRRRVTLPLDDVALIVAAETRGSGGAKGGADPRVPASSATVLAAAMMEHVTVKMDTREPRAMHITCLSRARIEHAWCVRSYRFPSRLPCNDISPFVLSELG